MTSRNGRIGGVFRDRLRGEDGGGAGKHPCCRELVDLQVHIGTGILHVHLPISNGLGPTTVAASWLSKRLICATNFGLKDRSRRKARQSRMTRKTL